MREFLVHELSTGIQKIPYTLSEFYGDYINFVLIQHLRANRFNYAPKHYRWNIGSALDRLAKAAYLHTVKGTPITEASLNKMMAELKEPAKENVKDRDEDDLGFRAFGLFEQDDGTKGFHFKETMIEEYLVAHYHFMECLRKVTAGKLNKVVTSTMKESMKMLPKTANIWRMTFGLLNSDVNLRDAQAPILKAIIQEAKKNLMTPCDITTLCIESIYESQNAGELAKLLDEFTLNQTVNFSNVHVPPARLPYTITAVGYLVRASPSVYGLHLNKFGLTAENVSLLADPVNAISDNNLQVMNLSSNNLGPTGIRRLQRFIVKASLLTHVDLSDCQIGNSGAALLSEFFMCLPMRYLRLSNNNIGDKGLINMVPNLKYAPTLEWLDMAGNLLTDKSVICLGKALPCLPNLRNLDLQRNKIGDEGADAISRQLSRLNRVTHLMLAQNLIGQSGASALAGHCWTTKSLRHVNLSLNNIPEEGILSLRKAVDDHGTLQIQVAGQEAGVHEGSMGTPAVLQKESKQPFLHFNYPFSCDISSFPSLQYFPSLFASD